MRHQILTKRDIEVVLDLYRYRYLRSSQIRDLHFPSLQTTNRRLKTLREQKLVKQFIVPNIPECIYHISKTGAKVVADQLGVTVSDLLWSQNTHAPKDYYFMRHFLAINQFRIDLTKACKDSEIELLGFIPEYFGQQHPSGRVTKYIKDFIFDARNPAEKMSHTPDAVFALAKSGKPALFFLEIDRGTEVLSNPEKGFLKMMNFYLNYAKAGKFKSYQQDFKCREFKAFRVLVITTGEKRLANMRQAAVGLPTGSAAMLKFIWLTTFNKLAPRSFFEKVWQSLDDKDRTIYSIT